MQSIIQKKRKSKLLVTAPEISFVAAAAAAAAEAAAAWWIRDVDQCGLLLRKFIATHISVLVEAFVTSQTHRGENVVAAAAAAATTTVHSRRNLHLLLTIDGVFVFCSQSSALS